MAGSDTTKRDSTTGREDVKRAAAETGDHLRDAAESATDAAALTYEELRDQLEMLKADLAGLADAARSAGKQTARKAYAGARRAGNRAATVAEESYEVAGERFDDAMTSAEDFVRERPAVALGLAAGGGFLLAMYLSRR